MSRSRLYCVGRVRPCGAAVILTLSRNEIPRVIAFETKAAAVASCMRLNEIGTLPLPDLTVIRQAEPVRVVETSALDLLGAGWRDFGIDVFRNGDNGNAVVVSSQIVDAKVARGATVASLERMLRRV
jgi:hypothetical protein